MLKSLLLSLLPPARYAALRRRWRALRDTLGLARAQAYDFRQYLRGSGLVRTTPGSRQANILKQYHRIEKGLALPAPRLGFGADAIALLVEDLDHLLRARRAGEPADWTVHAALRTLQAYVDFHAGKGQPRPELAARVAQMAAQAAQAGPPPREGAEGGLLARRRDEVLAAVRSGDFGAFLRTRHSVRQFAARPVEPALIEEAVSQARFAPSVCNRNGGRVYWVRDAARAQQLLRHQNGNRGFGDSAGALLVVTARQDAFLTVGERYQAWIDGGLFGMTLVYALHAQGLGSCCLNWSVEPEIDRAFKREAGIPQHDAVIMLLAVGHLREDFVVARSERRPLADVLIKL